MNRSEFLKNQREYNRKRELAFIDKKIKDDKAYNKELNKLYNKSLNEIQTRLESLYTRYARREGLTIDEAMKLADKMDVSKFAEKAKQYVKTKDFSKQANRELRLYNLKMKISRLELMKYEIMHEQMKLSDKETEMLFGRLKQELLDETKRQAGILGLGNDVVKEVLKKQDAIINGSFKSATFSDRIWANGYSLRNNLQSGLHNSLLLGDHPKDWARKLEKNLKKEMLETGKQNAFYYACRLAITESSRVQIETSTQLMKQGGFDKYMWIAEPTACHICAPFDGEIFDLGKSSIGETLPPMHPFCRCSVAAYYDIDEEI